MTSNYKMFLKHIKNSQLLKIKDIPKCRNNCLCENRMKILLQKIPINIIDEIFIKFQIKEQMDKYHKCYKNKKENI